MTRQNSVCSFIRSTGICWAPQALSSVSIYSIEMDTVPVLVSLQSKGDNQRKQIKTRTQSLVKENKCETCMVRGQQKPPRVVDA